jgi:hypothetical protein
MRVGFLVLVGLALGVAVVWYIGFLYQEVRGTGQIVIVPLTVIDSQGKANDELGKALAQMLHARLQSLAYELRDAQAGFTTNIRAPALPQGAPAAPVGDVRLWTQAVSLQTALLHPIDLKLSVGGVDVGGIIPWFQRWLSSRRTLHFTLYSQGTDAQVFGSLAALKSSDPGFRLHVKGSDGEAPSHDAIVDALAHEIVHRYLAQDTTNRLEVLDPSEFTSLARVLVRVAHANRNSILGRPAQKEFAALIPSITVLADRVPEWPELGYLAARVADSGRDSRTALTYYRRVQTKFRDSGQLELVGWINKRVSDLTSIPAEASTLEATVEPLPEALDYSSEIKFVRDSGPEGSVVGLALATALEFQIAKATKKQQRISARYIYYAARKAAGFDLESDNGAYIKDGIAVLSSEGAVAEALWPYRPGKFAEKPPAAVETAQRFRITDARLVTTVDDLKRALKQNGPVVAGITLFTGSTADEVSKTGVIPIPNKKEHVVGGHAIVIVGYDDQARRVKFVNSWGKQWGERGFGFLPYEYVEKYMDDAWTFTM